MDAVRELAQLVDGGLELTHGSRDDALELRGPPGRKLPLLDEQVERQRNEPLLRAVVEVALDAPSLGIRRGGDPRTGLAHVDERRPQLRLEAHVLERERRCGGDPLDEPRLLRERGVVDEDGDAPAVVDELRDSPPRVVSRQREGVSVGVHVDLLLGHPEPDLERLVVERTGDRVAHPRRRRALELANEVGDTRPRQALPEEADEQRDRNDDLHAEPLYSSFRRRGAKPTSSIRLPIRLAGRRQRARRPAARNVHAIATLGAACHQGDSTSRVRKR
jgi:hypothetical protein